MILKMMLIVFGIFLLILDLFMYARQKLTDGIGLGWAIVSATFLVSGIAVSRMQPHTCGMEQKVWYCLHLLCLLL